MQQKHVDILYPTKYFSNKTHNHGSQSLTSSMLYWWGTPRTESFIAFLDLQLPIGEVTWEHSSVYYQHLNNIKASYEIQVK